MIKIVLIFHILLLFVFDNAQSGNTWNNYNGFSESYMYHYHNQHTWSYTYTIPPTTKMPPKRIIKLPTATQSTERLVRLPTNTEPKVVDRNSEDYKPCESYNGKKPNFSVPNTRISERKCYEHIWNIKHIEEKGIRQLDCVKELAKKNIHAVLVGVDARPGEFPHMAAIGWKASSGTWIFKCGGSLISTKFVLTAGHCISASPRDLSISDVVPKIVRLGDRDIRDSYYFKNDKNITRIIKHPLYKAPIRYNDIAIFELDSAVTLSKTVNPACLWTKPDVSSLGTKGTVTGWGVVSAVTMNKSPILQAAVVDLIPTDTCQNLLSSYCNRHWCGLQDGQICAGTLAGGADTCEGDSGGPLQVKIPLPEVASSSIHYIIGVTSFGFKCGRANRPGIYTRVSSYLDWIEAVVWPEN